MSPSFAGGTALLELPTSETFVLIFNDPRFWFAVGIATLSGLVRGFSGFGSALIYIPLIASLFGPKVAAGTLVLVDFVSGVPFAIAARKTCEWKEVTPLAIMAAIGVPFGTYLLVFADPVGLRWLIAFIVLGLLIVPLSGWRYERQPTLPVTLGVGFIAGVGAGAVQVGGPAVIIYWLSSKSPPVVIRANLLVYFILNAIALIIFYALQGVLTPYVLAFVLLLGPPFWLAMALGGRLFRGASDNTYRQVAYVIVALAAVVSLPLFDGLIR